MTPSDVAGWVPWAVVAVLMVVALASYKLVLRLFGVVIIAEDTIGIVYKKFVIFGSNRTLPDGAIIALNGEAGWQADTLAPGVHYWLWPWQYDVKHEELIVVRQGFVGVMEARDGMAVTGGRVLGRNVKCDSFQNARQFIQNGGERGPQIAVILPGSWRVNTMLFTMSPVEAEEIHDNMVGIVTTKDGKPLSVGEIAGEEVAGHSSFQDGQAFINAGGFKGPQVQVILAGRYNINPKFATIEQVPLTEVEIAHVGVVIAYVGDVGEDVTGDTFKHGNLVHKDHKGVWVEPFDPGRYPINPRTHTVEPVSTANIVLNWATGKNESHKLDEHLSTIKVRSSDGFDYTMDVSQIIHIPRNDAPKVIARFGTVANLVTQVLEPTIGNYFRNAAQKSDVIAFLTERSIRQIEAKDAIKKALEEYNVVAVDTLIGDINPPPALMKPLTDRKIAEQEEITFGTQETAQDARKKLMQATATADTQAGVVTAQRSVEIAKFTADAAVARARGEAEAKTINAKADAEVTMVTGDALASKTKAVGTAEADVIKLKTEAMDPAKYAAVEIARALSTSGFRLVPDIMVAGGGDGKSGGTLVDVLLANLVKDGMVKNGHVPEPASAGAAAGTGTPTKEEDKK